MNHDNKHLIHLLATATTASILTYSTFAYLVPLLASTSLPFFPIARTSTATDGAESDDEDGKDKVDENKKKKKKYEEKNEHYDPLTGRFEPMDEEVVVSKDFYFCVKHRSWPKSSDYQGSEDYKAVEITSQVLVNLLRPELKEVEEMFEDSPSLNSKDLFLHLDKLKKLLARKKEELDEVKKREEEEAKEAAEKDKVDSEDKETKESPGKVDPIEKKEGPSDTVVATATATASTSIAPNPPSTSASSQPDSTSSTSSTPSHTSAIPTVSSLQTDSEPSSEPVSEEQKPASTSPLDEDDSDENKEKQTSSEVEVDIEHLTVLLDYMDELYAPTVAKLSRFETDGVISFTLLWVIFHHDRLVEMQDETSGERIAFRVKSASYAMSRDGLQFSISGTRIVWTGTKYIRTWSSATIPKFKGMKKMTSLPVHPLTDKNKEALTARGRLYTDLAGVKFLEYSGNLVQVLGSGMERRIIKLRAEGRCVVDVKSFRRMNPSRNVGFDEYDEAEYDDDYGDHGDHGYVSGLEPRLGDSVPEEELCLLPPIVYGFSLVQREWGELRVDQFKEVVFNNEAWSHLVLDPNYKDLIKSLVEQNSQLSKQKRVEQDAVDSGSTAITDPASSRIVTDVIAGKGGGIILALHGRPGVGKTLTGEAISEFLQVPLYSVGAGELGVSADILEKRLRDVLDTSMSWGGVLLVDEADVFLEARAQHDVSRNALVSVFLRLLEYHQGILILTTNRIRTLDPAFLSRFSIAITYPDLNFKKRRSIWASFLKLAGVVVEGEVKALTNGISSGAATPIRPAPSVSAKYLDNLATKPLNGRTIKNITRTAQALSLSKGEPLGESHIDTVVKVTEQFTEDFKSEDEEGVYDAPGEGWKDRTNLYQ